MQRLNNQGQNVYSGTWTLVPCVQTVYISVLRQSTAKLMFQNGVSVKWSNYEHSYVLGTQNVNQTPFCTGTQAGVLRNQVWTAP